MRIRVKKTKDASADGIIISTYEKGKVYDMPDDLGGVFIAQKWGRPEKIEAVELPKPEENKGLKPVIEVK